MRCFVMMTLKCVHHHSQKKKGGREVCFCFVEGLGHAVSRVEEHFTWGGTNIFNFFFRRIDSF